MDDLEKKLQRLSKINPDEGFVKASKARLMVQITTGEKEVWFKNFIKRVGFSAPSTNFIYEARARLMAQIRDLPQPVKIPLQGLAYFLNFLKKAVASTTIMVIAVTAVLFQLEGNTVVEASNDSYLEVTSGQVFIKHSDSTDWEEVKTQLQLKPEDLIQVKEGAGGVIHFFDDTQVRLNENTTFKINELEFSPVVSDQGIIETSLESGEAWVQTLNVEDGYAGFTLHTKEAILHTLNAAFSVESVEKGPGEIAVFNGSLSISTFSPDKGQLTKKAFLTANKVLNLALDKNANTNFIQAQMTPELIGRAWVQDNLKKDQEHLAYLREQDYDRLTLMAGTLPGDLLYPIKQAKELLKLELTGNSDSSVKIEIANNRLNEAIILFERGENEKGQEALEAYQNLTREILATNQKPENSEKLITQLVVPHQKVLSTQPSDKNSIKVKEALQQTAEILAQNPLELENIKLKNSVSNLKDILALIETGQLDLAKEKMSKYKSSEVQTDLLEGLQDPAAKREAYEGILNLKEEEKGLLAMVSEKTNGLAGDNNKDLVAMVEVASKEAEVKTDEIKIAALPTIPELAQEISMKPDPNPSPETSTPSTIIVDSVPQEAKTIADRINIYSAWNGQYNQIQRLLGAALEDPSKIDFLIEVQTYLEGQAKNYLNTRILQLQNKLTLEEDTLKKEEQTPIVPVDPSVTPVLEVPISEETVVSPEKTIETPENLPTTQVTGESKLKLAS